MKKNTIIKEGLSVKEIKKKNKSTISVIDNEKEHILSEVKTDDYFWSDWIHDDNYIMAYSRGCIVNQLPLNIEGAYSIKNHKIIDVSNKKIKDLLKQMLIFKQGFDLIYVLAEINDKDLQLLYNDEKNGLSEYLTAGNKDISHKEIVDYILKTYPKLKKYTNLTNLSIVEYRNIQKELGMSTLWFNIMPQDVEKFENIEIPNLNNYRKMNTSESEYEYQSKPKTLSRKK